MNKQDKDKILEVIDSITTSSEELSKALEIIKAIPIDEVKWPQKGDMAYIVNLLGVIDYRKYDDGIVDKVYLTQGRILKTKEQAEWFVNYEQKQAKKLDVLYEFEMWVKEFNEGWVANWDDAGQVKYNLCFHSVDKKISLSGDRVVRRSNGSVLKSNGIERLRTHFGDRLNVLFEN